MRERERRRDEGRWGARVEGVEERGKDKGREGL